MVLSWMVCYSEIFLLLKDVVPKFFIPKVIIPKGHYSERLLFQKVFILKLVACYSKI